MSGSELSGLQHEWNQLQQQFDSYEKFSLIIKLVSVLLLALLLFHNRFDRLVPILCLVLWGQDAIWKTFQARIGERLLVVESAIIEQQGYKAMQFHTSWLASRPSAIGLILQYAKQAVKPTVLYPHLILIAVGVWLSWT